MNGVLRCAGKNNQGIVEEVWYSILKNEYESNFQIGSGHRAGNQV